MGFISMRKQTPISTRTPELAIEMQKDDGGLGRSNTALTNRHNVAKALITGGPYMGPAFDHERTQRASTSVTKRPTTTAATDVVAYIQSWLDFVAVVSI
jgi:hypothetical protein